MSNEKLIKWRINLEKKKGSIAECFEIELLSNKSIDVTWENEPRLRFKPGIQVLFVKDKNTCNEFHANFCNKESKHLSSKNVF